LQRNKDENRMRIIAHRTITAYYKLHTDAKTALESWYRTVKLAKWKDFYDVKKTFNNADYVGNQRYVFNIKGNNYRLIGKILFVQQIIYIRFIGTHKAYEKIDCSTI
jgi:mRNA interferase HigB